MAGILEPGTVRIGLSRKESDFFTLPIDPQISVDGGPQIAFSEVAKKHEGGTVKEYWSAGDWVFDVVGFLMDNYAQPGRERLPIEEQYAALLKRLTAPQNLFVEGEIFSRLGVSQVVATNIRLPYTEGDNNVKYSFRLTSDFPFQLLI